MPPDNQGAQQTPNNAEVYLSGKLVGHMVDGSYVALADQNARANQNAQDSIDAETDRQNNPNKEGFVSALGSEVKRAVKSIPGMLTSISPGGVSPTGEAEAPNAGNLALQTIQSVIPGWKKDRAAGMDTGQSFGRGVLRAAGTNLDAVDADAANQDLPGALGHLAPTMAMAVAPRIAPMIGEAGSAIRDAAMENPDRAALRALNVSPNSVKAARTLEDVKAIRPYTEGVKTNADLATRLNTKTTGIKAEVWKPYNDAVQKIANKPIQGPEGPTTVGQLEARRLELSAQNRGLRSRDPEALRTAEQAGLKQADYIKLENDTKAALDPELRNAGVDPKLIRKVFGAASRISNKVTGRATELDKQPVGIGKIVKGARAGVVGGTSEGRGGLGEFITEPLTRIAGGARDIAAGRGFWSASPMDTAVREGFRGGGAKPNFALNPNPGAVLPAVPSTPQLAARNAPTGPNEQPSPLPPGGAYHFAMPSETTAEPGPLVRTAGPPPSARPVELWNPKTGRYEIVRMPQSTTRNQPIGISEESNAPHIPATRKVLSKSEMIRRGADGYLDKAVEMEIPISQIEGREPVPAMEGGYKKGTVITQPVELEYNPDTKKYTLYSGNHRVRQAEVNGQDTIKAFVQGKTN